MSFLLPINRPHSPPGDEISLPLPPELSIPLDKPDPVKINTLKSMGYTPPVSVDVVQTKGIEPENSLDQFRRVEFNHHNAIEIDSANSTTTSSYLKSNKATDDDSIEEGEIREDNSVSSVFDSPKRDADAADLMKTQDTYVKLAHFSRYYETLLTTSKDLPITKDDTHKATLNPELIRDGHSVGTCHSQNNNANVTSILATTLPTRSVQTQKKVEPLKAKLNPRNTAGTESNMELFSKRHKVEGSKKVLKKQAWVTNENKIPWSSEGKKQTSTRQKSSAAKSTTSNVDQNWEDVKGASSTLEVVFTKKNPSLAEIQEQKKKLTESTASPKPKVKRKQQFELSRSEIQNCKAVAVRISKKSKAATEDINDIIDDRPEDELGHTDSEDDRQTLNKSRKLQSMQPRDKERASLARHNEESGSYAESSKTRKRLVPKKDLKAPVHGHRKDALEPCLDTKQLKSTPKTGNNSNNDNSRPSPNSGTNEMPNFKVPESNLIPLIAKENQSGTPELQPAPYATTRPNPATTSGHKSVRDPATLGLKPSPSIDLNKILKPKESFNVPMNRFKLTETKKEQEARKARDLQPAPSTATGPLGTKRKHIDDQSNTRTKRISTEQNNKAKKYSSGPSRPNKRQAEDETDTVPKKKSATTGPRSRPIAQPKPRRYLSYSEILNLAGQRQQQKHVRL